MCIISITHAQQFTLNFKCDSLRDRSIVTVNSEARPTEKLATSKSSNNDTVSMKDHRVRCRQTIL